MFTYKLKKTTAKYIASNS